MGDLVAAAAPAAFVDALVFPAGGWLVAVPPVDRTVVAVRPATVVAVGAPGTVVAASADPAAGALLSPEPLEAGTVSLAALGTESAACGLPWAAATTSLWATLVPHAASRP